MNSFALLREKRHRNLWDVDPCQLTAPIRNETELEAGTELNRTAYGNKLPACYRRLEDLSVPFAL